VRSLALLVMIGLCACASAPSGPVFRDEQYLRFGVDPDAEANAIIAERERLGEALVTRLLGQHFTALGFADHSGAPIAVRVITARGIELALDRTRPASLQTPENFELLPAPLSSTHDADGDGFEEVFVRWTRGQERCLRAYRVRDVGFVDPVPLDFQLFGQTLCPTDFDDIDKDGRIELLAEVALVGVELPRQAAVRVLSCAADHRFSVSGPSAARSAWLAAERAPRALELQEARAQRDVRWVLQLSFELAALALLDGADTAQQLATFDGGTAGLVFDADEQAAVLSARDRIAKVWSAPLRSP
jgi:hypothetical protein